MEMLDSELWQLRATAWELAAFSFRHPTRELAQAVAGGEWLAAAREVAAALDLVLPGGFGEGVPSACEQPSAPSGDVSPGEGRANACDASGQKANGENDTPAENPGGDAALEEFFHKLRAEATRLFVGPGEPACSPYEGVWRAKAEGVKPLLFVSTHAMEVERFVKSCGFTRPAGTNDPFDHIATECELLEALALRAVRAEDEEQCPNAALAHELYGQFLDEHMRTWAGDFCNKLSEEAREPFYRAAAAYLQALVR